MTVETLKLINPSTALLPRWDEQVAACLRYRDKSVEFQLQKLKRDRRFRGQEWAEDRIRALTLEQDKVAAWGDGEGNWFTYSGLVKILQNRFGWEVDSSSIDYPEPKILPWNKAPQHTPRFHQEAAITACIKHAHCGIEMPTGSGKSMCINRLVKHYGLQAVVMAPSVSICEQLYEEFKQLFGLARVGMYGGRKREFKKLITVAVAQSLTKIPQDSEEWDALSRAKVFVSDESHTTPSETMERVCMGIMKDAPYRFFFSATQLRNDGSSIVLDGITRGVQYSVRFDELVEAGILSRPIFKMFQVPKTFLSNFPDAKKETRAHLYGNPNVSRLVAQLANKCVEIGRPTVILIEEMKQFAQLYSMIKVPFVFAHGGSDSEMTKREDLAGIPKHLLSMDPTECVKKFNSGEVSLIIGTSCIATGTDLRPTQALINLQGGTSPIKVLQGLGRGTRVVPGKKDFWAIDFKIMGSPTLERHAEVRRGIYESLSVGTVKLV